VSRAVRVNTTLDADLLERIDAFANERREDRSTAIRQLVDIALRELSKRDALIAYRQGRLTIREFAAALNLDVWGAHDLLAAEGVAIAQGSRAETVDALQRLMSTTAPGRPRSRRSADKPRNQPKHAPSRARRSPTRGFK
jgi:hypothetical protein